MYGIGTIVNCIPYIRGISCYMYYYIRNILVASVPKNNRGIRV